MRASHQHVLELARTMRSADVEECWACTRNTPLEAAQTSAAASTVARTLLFDGVVAGVFGVVPTVESALGGPQRGIVWALTADVVHAAPLAYVAWSRRLLAELLDYCPSLFNVIDERYTQALRWAEWLGFSLVERVHLGPRRRPFLLAEIRR